MGIQNITRIATSVAKAGHKTIAQVLRFVEKIKEAGVVEAARNLGRKIERESTFFRGRRLRRWYRENEPSIERLAQQRARIWPTNAPRIALLIAIRSRADFRKVLRNLQKQTYRAWEVVLIADKKLASKVSEDCPDNDRIRLLALPEGTNTASGLELARQLATGDFVGVAGAADVLSPHALYELAEHILDNPDCDVVYCDEDCFSPFGRRHGLRLKPSWSPEMLLGCNYIGRLALIRRDLLQTIGGFNARFHDAQEYDALLRIGQRTSRIHRLPHCLYHRRAWKRFRPGFANDGSATCREGAVCEHLGRLGLQATAHTLRNGLQRLEWPISNPPLVSVIIPTLDNPKVLKQCVEDLRHKTDYSRLEIILVDNDSTNAEVLQYYRDLTEARAAAIVPYHRKFNYSEACNLGARHAAGELLLFLNNDISVIDPSWLSEMVRFAMRPGVGCVGAKLLYPDGVVQHAGVMVGLHLCGLLYNQASSKHWDEFGSPDMYRNTLAIMGACQLVPASAFEAVGGFNERYWIANSDVALCLRLFRAGFRTVFTPHAALHHHEGYTRGKRNPVQDMQMTASDIREMGISEDPYFHPALSACQAIPTLRLAPEPSPRDLLEIQIARILTADELTSDDIEELLHGRISPLREQH